MNADLSFAEWALSVVAWTVSVAIILLVLAFVVPQLVHALAVWSRDAFPRRRPLYVIRAQRHRSHRAHADDALRRSQFELLTRLGDRRLIHEAETDTMFQLAARDARRAFGPKDAA